MRKNRESKISNNGLLRITAAQDWTDTRWQYAAPRFTHALISVVNTRTGEWC